MRNKFHFISQQRTAASFHSSLKSKSYLILIPKETTSRDIRNTFFCSKVEWKINYTMESTLRVEQTHQKFKISTDLISKFMHSLKSFQRNLPFHLTSAFHVQVITFVHELSRIIKRMMFTLLTWRYLKPYSSVAMGNLWLFNGKSLRTELKTFQHLSDGWIKTSLRSNLT